MSQTPVTTHRSIVSSALLLLMLGASLVSPGWAELDAPDHTVYGTATANGVLVTSGVVDLRDATSGAILVEYHLGATPAFGERFVLRLPMDVREPQQPNTAREGDQVEVYLDGVLAGEATVGAPGTAQELDIDPFFNAPPDIWIGDASVAEGDSGMVPAQLEVRISRPVFFDVTVSWQTRDGVAVAGADYLAAAGTVIVPAGEVTTMISVSVLGETTVEPNESFFVDLSDPINATLLDAEGEVTILADDAEWVLSVLDADQLEGDGGLPVEVRFLITAEELVPSEAPSGGNLSVDYTTVDDTAIAGSDYQAVSGTALIDLSILCPEVGLPCAEVLVPLLPDNVEEPTETFFLDLTPPVPNPQGIALGRARAVGRIHSDEHFLLFVESERTDESCSDCLQNPLGGALTHDGRHLYVSSNLNSGLWIYERDHATGALTPLALLRDGVSGVDGLSGANGVAISPDDQFVYVAGFLEDEIAVFERDPITGLLTFLEANLAGPTSLDGPVSLVVSPDGNHLYTTGKNSNSIAIFARQSDGRLSLLGAVRDGQTGVDGLLSPRGLAISPDGGQVYATSPVDSAVSQFSRNSATGLLTWLGMVRDATGNPPIDGLNGVASLVVSPDGAHVYAAGELDDSVAVLARDEVSGLLTWQQRRRNGLAGVEGLDGAAAVAVSAEGDYVFVASRLGHGLATFERDGDPGSSTYGNLTTFVEARRDGDLDPRGVPGPDGPQLDGLEGGIAIISSPVPDGRHLYILGADDDAIAVFFKDTVAPDVALFVSPTPSGHVPGTWSNDPALEIGWSAADDPLGVGLAGYPVLFDQSSTSDPGTTLSQLHDPIGLLQLAATNTGEGANHYIHVRACDLVDNCGPVGHQGPFLIDLTPPAGPMNPTSTSHTPGLPSMSTHLAMQWTAASDPLSGLEGYAGFVDSAPSSSCPTATNLAPTATTDLVDLVDGSWYYHLCARDVAGNWNPVEHAGPFVIDATPPQVRLVSTVSATANGQLDSGETLLVPVTQLIVGYYDESLTGIQESTSYRLLEAGSNGVLETTSCGPLAGDDVPISTNTLFFEPNTQTVALPIGSGSSEVSASTGLYRWMVCSGNITDSAANPLDGNGDGIGGDDLRRDFRVPFQQQLSNPNFDLSIDLWNLGGSPFQRDLSDVDGTFSSGSIWIADDFNPPAVHNLSQCVGVPGEPDVVLGGRSLIASLTPGEPRVFSQLAVYSTTDCGGVPTHTITSQPIAGDTGGLWTSIPPTYFTLPATAGSIRIRFLIDGDSAPNSNVNLDALSFRESSLIFADGFETGDTSAW
ncbi:MAG: beta-propeller fold lactonase family protein [Thermoanaerobaculia bacterium]|nr:beta-propeller fold lactonase family protein [Thermoanaerobaculia bacterium]